jgi:amino acid adenylation domain-containing protein
MLFKNRFKRLSNPSPLSAEELQEVLVELNLAVVDAPKDENVHQLWEERAALIPEATAIIWEERQISYGELNSRVNRLAYYLRGVGVRSETIVCVYLNKSISRIVALLAILKAGGTYLPIDPDYPQARIQHILDDSQAEIIITQATLRDKLQTKAQIIDLDRDEVEIVSQEDSNLENINTGNHLAYIIYTSGSTGKPKGVLIEHKAISFHIQTVVTHYQLTERDRILQFASVGFDVSLEQILSSLIAGATLVLDDTKHLTGEEFQQKISQLGLTVINLPPAYWSQWVQAIAGKKSGENIPNIGNLRLVICGGEAMSPVSLKLWQNSPLKDIRLLNAYGPTEATITAMIFEIDKNTAYERVPIGRPLTNRQAYILDRELQLTPTGIQGELYLGGVGIGRGYLNRPQLTGEKFIDNPWEEGKLYKTGDLARYLTDGNVEFIGRADNQVKIRGFRIELGEIEAVLCQHPHIGEAVVVVRDDMVEGNCLVAYIVGQNSSSIEVGEIRKFLQQQLPEYMIPNIFLVLDKFPVTPHGKIDKRNLPLPKVNASDRTILEPSNPQEAVLVNIWREVFQLEAVSVADNFLELGGHSLLATQIISRIREAFELELPLDTIFKSPTIRELSQIVARSSDINNNSLTPPPNLPQIQRRDIKAEEKINIPLSFSQERLWFLNQLEGDGATYNISTTLRLTGKLNLDALRRSISTIVERHEILRTNFAAEEDTANSCRQIIRDNSSIDIPLIDLQPLARFEKTRQIEKTVRESSRYSFNLADEPLLRIELLRLREENHLLVLTIHHIISDGWSMGIFLEELATLYRVYSLGEDSPLPELPIQYADFAIWQKQHFPQTVFETQLDYWREKLAGLPPLLELPTDKPRPPRQTFAGNSLSFELSSELTEQLKQIGRESGVTLYTILLAALAILLSRYSHQTDIPIGTAIANRTRKEVESLIGFFVNTLVLRFDLDENLQFRELIERARQITLESYANQDIPFEKVVEELQPERSLSYHPLFQVMFVWQNTLRRKWELSELKIDEQPINTGTAKFDITLSLEEKDGCIAGFWEYNTDIFEIDTIARMMSHFRTLLGTIASNPQQKILKLPLISPRESQQLLQEWNQTATNYPKDKSIHQLFETQAAATPDAVALVWEDKQLTYRELNEKANRLARYLRSLGVKPDVLVGICLERSFNAIVGMLGILKAGGAYLPLAPDTPQDRSTFILDNAKVSIVLSQQSLLNSLPAEGINIIRLDTDWRSIESENPNNLESDTNPEHLAYVTYTSGSTGVPKGVCIPHRGVVRLVKETNYVNFSADEVFLQLAPMAFDASTFEIWGSLLNGAKLVLFPQDKPSLAELDEIIRQQQITTLWLTAGLFHLMVDERLEALRPLRQLLAGGDVLSVPHVRKVLENLDCRLINGYGPTENTTFSCCYTVAKTDNLASSVAIGYPISNTQLYILDRHLRSVPIGVVGEIYLGGDGLATGYLNNPDLTAEKFIPNPFGTGKLYKTGDLGRYLRDGRVEFAGRTDNQVKIRGFRLELTEIEAVLAQHNNIKEAVTIVWEGFPNDKRLVAYIVPVRETVEIGEIRDFLRQKLPEYAIPDTFITLEKLPLNSNGKVDRRSELLLIRTKVITTSGELVSPRNDLERKLVEIWEEVLGIKPIGVRDNFFNVGGHSLLAIELFARIEKAFYKALPLADIFQYPTIELLADRLKIVVKPTDWQFLVPIQPKGSKSPLFCMPTYRGTPVGLKLSTFLDLDRPVYSFKPLGADGKQAPHTTLEEMATAYIREMLLLQPEGAYFLMGISFGTRLAFEVARQLQRQGKKVALLALLDSTAGLSVRNPNIVKSKSNFTLKEANLHAFNSYIARHYAGKVTLFRAKSEIFRRYYPDPAAGWGELALGGIEIHDLPGVHTTFFKHPHIQVLGAKLKDCLERASTKEPPNLSASIVATEFDPSNAAFHRTLARIQSKEGNLDKEIASLQKAIEIDHLQPMWVYKNLGEALVDRGDREAIINLYRQAIERIPNNPYLYCLLGKALVEMGDIPQAATNFERAIALEPKNPVVYVQLGNALERGGIFERARAAYRKVVELEPKNPYSHQLLGNICAKQGDMKGAIDCFETAVKLEPTNADASLRLGNALNQNKQFDRAIVAFERTISSRPKNNQIAAPYQGLGQAYYQKEQFDRAIIAFERAIDLKPEQIESYKGLSNSWLKKDDLAAANIILRKALQLQPNNADIHHNLGNIYLQQDKLDLAIVHFKKAIELQPDRSQLYCILGDIYGDRINDFKTAIEYLQKALELKIKDAAGDDRDSAIKSIEEKIARIQLELANLGSE